MTDVKVKSFRIDNDTAQKFKEIADSLGTNQQDTMQLLINAYCMQEQKSSLTDYKADLERIEGYTTAILQMYTASLQANKDAKETAKADFNALLKSKDAIIQELQEKLADAKAVKDDAVTKADILAKENEDFKNLVTNLQSQLTDKDNLNKALTNSYNKLESKVVSVEEARKQSEAIRNKLASKEKEIITLQAELEKVQRQIEILQEQSKLNVKIAILEAKEKYQVKIDEYQKKYKELLERFNTAKETIDGSESD